MTTEYKRPPPVEDFCRRLEDALANSPFAGMTEDIKNNVRIVAENVLSRMDVVSRAEFEAQAAMLARAHEKLDALQAQLDALEKAPPPPPADDK